MADDAKLIAVVEANTKQFENAIKRLEGVTKNSTDRMTASVKKLDASFTGLAGAAGRFGTALSKIGISVASLGSVTLLINKAREAITALDGIGDAATKAGVAGKTLQVLRYALEQSEGSAEGADEALQKLNKTIGEASIKTKGEAAKAFKQLGIDIRDASGALRSTDDILADAMNRLARVADASQRAAAASRIFGKSAGPEMAALAAQGTQALTKYTDELMDRGLFSDEALRRADLLDKKLKGLTQTWDVLWKSILVGESIDLKVHLVFPGPSELTKLTDEYNRLMSSIGPTTKGLGGTVLETTEQHAISEQAQAVKDRIDAILLARELAFEAGRARSRGFGTGVPITIPEDIGGGGGGGGGSDQTEKAFAAALQNAGDFAFSVKQAPARYQRGIFEAATAQGIPPNLLASILHAESGFAPDVISGKRRSSAGAIGIAQFMPATAAGLGVNPTDPSSSIVGAARYLRQLIDMFNGDVASAVAAYNAGPGRVKSFLAGKSGLPAETQAYVPKVMDATTFSGQSQAAADAAKELADNYEEINRNAYEAGLATIDIKDSLNAANAAFKRDLVGGFVRDLEHGVKPAEALANALQKISDRLLDMALNAIFPDVGGGIIGAITGLAGGGVMTGRGPMPLRKYAGGGVAHSPQMAVFGEGHGAEAFVPLPDGRRIPVNIRVPGMGGLGGGRGGQAVAVHNRVTVDPSPLFITTTHAVARQGGRDAVVEASDGARRRAGGR
jgi:hypothetical protein